MDMVREWIHTLTPVTCSVQSHYLIVFIIVFQWIILVSCIGMIIDQIYWSYTWRTIRKKWKDINMILFSIWSVYGCFELYYLIQHFLDILKKVWSVWQTGNVSKEWSETQVQTFPIVPEIFDTSSKIFHHLDKWCGVAGLQKISFTVEICPYKLSGSASGQRCLDRKRNKTCHCSSIRTEVSRVGGWMTGCLGSWDVISEQSRKQDFSSWTDSEHNSYSVTCHFCYVS